MLFRYHLISSTNTSTDMHRNTISFFDRQLKHICLGESTGGIESDCEAAAMICRYADLCEDEYRFVYEWSEGSRISIIHLIAGFLDALSYLQFSESLFEAQQQLKSSLYSAVFNAIAAKRQINVTHLLAAQRPDITQWIVRMWRIPIHLTWAPRLP